MKLRQRWFLFSHNYDFSQLNHILIWYVSQQLNYGDTCEICTWSRILKNCENNRREEIGLVRLLLGLCLPILYCAKNCPANILWRFHSIYGLHRALVFANAALCKVRADLDV